MTAGRSDPFVGREPEFRQLAAALSDSVSGRGRTALLVGEPGIGKTRIAERLSDTARSQGVEVLWGQCPEHAGTPAYWPWVQVLRSYIAAHGSDAVIAEMGANAGPISGIDPAIRTRLGLETTEDPSGTPQTRQFRMFDALVGFFAAASAARPLMIVLDDIHWADRASLDLLHFVATQTVTSPVLLVGTYRDTELGHDHPLSDALAKLTRVPGSIRVQLAGLLPAEVEALLSAGRVAPRRDEVEIVCARTGGNPLFIAQLAQLARADRSIGEASDWAERLPDAIREVIKERISRLPERCIAVLGVAAVIGETFDFDLLVGISEQAAEDVSGLVDAALAAHVIQETPGATDNFTFNHALIREVIYLDLPPGARARLHARVGAKLEAGAGADLEGLSPALAYHFGRSTRISGRTKVVRYSLMAGHSALRSYAWNEAMAHFQRAIDAGGKTRDESVAEGLHGLGLSQMALLPRADRQAAVKTLQRAFDLYVALGMPDRAVKVLDTHIVPVTGITRVASLMKNALDLVTGGGTTAGPLLVRYAHALNVEQGAFDEATAAIVQARKLAIAQDDETLELLAGTTELSLLNHDMRYGELLPASTTALSLAIRLGRRDLELRARYFLTFALIFAGDLSNATDNVTRTLAIADAVQDNNTREQCLNQIMHLAMLEGDWNTLQSAMDRQDELDRVSAAACRAILAFESGDFEKGTRILDTSTGAVATGQAAIAAWRCAHISRDGELLAQAETLTNGLVATSGLTRVNRQIRATARLLIAVERSDHAAAAAYRQLSPDGPLIEYVFNPHPSRVLGLAAFAAGDPGAAARHFEDAMASCRAAGFRPELAWTACDYASALLGKPALDAKTAARTRELVDEGGRIAGELGMVTLAGRLKELSEKLTARRGRRSQHPDALTDREIEVLRLIGAGRSNREIGEALVISENTVIRHVSNIFTKTGAANRAEAATYAARHDLGQVPDGPEARG